MTANLLRRTAAFVVRNACSGSSRFAVIVGIATAIAVSH